eukprot:Em0014g623a
MRRCTKPTFASYSNNFKSINISKCQFGCDTIDFLGHHITHTGIAPLPDKVDAITQCAQPTTVKGLQEFVDMVNFYHRCSLAGKPKTLTWSEAMGKAFVATKKALAEVALLAHPCHGVPQQMPLTRQ